MVNKTDFVSPIQTNEFLPPISRWTSFGGMIILGILSLAIPVAAIAKYKVNLNPKNPTPRKLRFVSPPRSSRARVVSITLNTTLGTVEDS